jgi:hypothetical protein
VESVQKDRFPGDPADCDTAIEALQSKRLQHRASGDMIANETISQFNDLAI